MASTSTCSRRRANSTSSSAINSDDGKRRPGGAAKGEGFMTIRPILPWALPLDRRGFLAGVAGAATVASTGTGALGADMNLVDPTSGTLRGTRNPGVHILQSIPYGDPPTPTVSFFPLHPSQS